jgi:hypothetical protein
MLAIFISLIVIAGLFNVANGSITTTGQVRKQQRCCEHFEQLSRLYRLAFLQRHSPCVHGTKIGLRVHL